MCCANGLGRVSTVSIWPCVLRRKKEHTTALFCQCGEINAENGERNLCNRQKHGIGAAFCSALPFSCFTLFIDELRVRLNECRVYEHFLIMMFTLPHSFDDDDTPITNMVRERVAKRITFQNRTHNDDIRNEQSKNSPTNKSNNHKIIQKKFKYSGTYRSIFNNVPVRQWHDSKHFRHFQWPHARQQ